MNSNILVEELFTSAINFNRLTSEAVNISEKLSLNEITHNSRIKLDLEEFWVPVEYDLPDLIAMPSKSLGRALGIYLLSMTNDQAAIHGVPAPTRFPISHPIDANIYKGSNEADTRHSSYSY